MVKGLLRIVLAGFAAFMVTAMAQEWSFFSAAWFGGGEPEPTLSAAARSEATRSLYLFLQVSSHFYGSAGDPRFADRLPAGEAVLAELRADVDYLRDNGRLQQPRLGRVEVVTAEPLGGDRIELQTREWWHVRTLWIESGEDSDAARAVKTFARYLLVPTAADYRVEAWEPLAEDPSPGETLEALPEGAASPSG